MKKIILIVGLIILYTESFSQPLSHGMGTSPQEFNILNYVSTKNDFYQDTLTVDQIDKKIISIIQEQSSLSFLDMEVPINSKKLEYLGYITPSQTNVFYFKIDTNSVLGHLANIYKYENLYISTQSNKLEDRYLVYYAIRNYLITKYKLETINEFLIKNTSQIPENYITSETKNRINFNENYFIFFDGINLNPTSEFYQGELSTNYFGKSKEKVISHNTHVIYFNKKTIFRGGYSGIQSEPQIYKSIKDSEKLFHQYMRDGYIHSFVHERIHNYISNSLLFNPLCNLVRKDCETMNIVPRYYELEEPIVNNTTNVLFEMLPNNGGLSADVINYYEEEFEISLRKFNTSKKLDKINNSLLPFFKTNLVSVFFNDSKFRNDINRQILFINFYDPDNQPILINKKLPTPTSNKDQQKLQQEAQQKQQQKEYEEKLKDPAFKAQMEKQIADQKRQMEQQKMQLEQSKQMNPSEYQKYFQQMQVQQQEK